MNANFFCMSNLAPRSKKHVLGHIAPQRERYDTAMVDASRQFELALNVFEGGMFFQIFNFT